MDFLLVEKNGIILFYSTGRNIGFFSCFFLSFSLGFLVPHSPYRVQYPKMAESCMILLASNEIDIYGEKNNGLFHLTHLNSASFRRSDSLLLIE
jgi:hypothetical protein